MTYSYMCHPNTHIGPTKAITKMESYVSSVKTSKDSNFLKLNEAKTELVIISPAKASLEISKTRLHVGEIDLQPTR